MTRLFPLLLLPLLSWQLLACGTLAATGSQRPASEYGFGEPASAQPSDYRISASVRQRLIEADGINASGLTITTEQGVVTLQGKVENSAIRDRIIMLSRQTPGVHRVNDRLTVNRP